MKLQGCRNKINATEVWLNNLEKSSLLEPSIKVTLLDTLKGLTECVEVHQDSAEELLQENRLLRKKIDKLASDRVKRNNQEIQAIQSQQMMHDGNSIRYGLLGNCVSPFRP